MLRIDNLIAFCGQSAIVGPNGQDLKRHGKETSGLIYCDYNRDDYISDVERNDYLQLRRPDLYSLS